jgi:hypothetical protein
MKTALVLTCGSCSNIVKNPCPCWEINPIWNPAYIYQKKESNSNLNGLLPTLTSHTVTGPLLMWIRHKRYCSYMCGVQLGYRSWYNDYVMSWITSAFMGKFLARSTYSLILPRIHSNTGTNITSYWMGTKDSLMRDKAVRSWSWPLTSNYWQSCMKLYLHTLIWCMGCTWKLLSLL